MAHVPFQGHFSALEKKKKQPLKIPLKVKSWLLVPPPPNQKHVFLQTTETSDVFPPSSVWLTHFSGQALARLNLCLFVF